jgi:hypothetical protein
VEPLASEPSYFEVDIAIEKSKGFKSPDVEQIPAEIIQAGGATSHSETHKCINSISN